MCTFIFYVNNLGKTKTNSKLFNPYLLKTYICFTLIKNLKKSDNVFVDTNLIKICYKYYIYYIILSMQILNKIS